MADDSVTQQFLRWRQVETPCELCRGVGTTWYSNGATWAGGMGTASCERDICDRCWGTGDEHKRGRNLRAWRDSYEKRIAEGGLAAIARAAGVLHGGKNADVLKVADELERLADGRRMPSVFVGAVVRSLASLLRRAVDERGDPLPRAVAAVLPGVLAAGLGWS